MSNRGGPVDQSLAPLRDIIARHGLTAKRSFGQHFLLDQNLTQRIARSVSMLASCNIIEIGAGPGGLTRALLSAGASRVFAVEKDERCVAALDELRRAYPERLEVIFGDATELDLIHLVPAPRIIVANLPYNVSTTLWISWLQRASEFGSFTLMFQKEVAERLVAAADQKSYGRLSVITQWLCKGEVLFNVDRRAFTPPPKVTSSLVRLVPRPNPLAEADWDAMETVTRQLFGQRRKMLRSTIQLLGLNSETIGIDPGKRPENLRVEEFCAVARAWRMLQSY